MARDLLSLPSAVRETPDPAVAALPVFRRLRDALTTAARFRDACRKKEAAARRWGEPAVFFFHTRLPLTSSRPTFPDPYSHEAARRDAEAAAAWHALPDLLDDADRLLGTVEVRHAARALPGMVDAARNLAPDHPRVAELLALLAVPDDEVFLVLDPEVGAGWRVRVRGVADVGQFHVLLADAVSRNRPDPLAVAAYRNRARISGDTVPVASACFQLFRPQAVRRDGTLPPGMSGSDHWLWHHRPLGTVPVVDGERVVLIGPPAFPAEWDAEPRFPHVPAAVEVVQSVSVAAVDEWLRDWCGTVPVRRPTFVVRRAA